MSSMIGNAAHTCDHLAAILANMDLADQQQQQQQRNYIASSQQQFYDSQYVSSASSASHSPQSRHFIRALPPLPHSIREVPMSVEETSEDIIIMETENGESMVAYSAPSWNSPVLPPQVLRHSGFNSDAYYSPSVSRNHSRSRSNSFASNLSLDTNSPCIASSPSLSRHGRSPFAMK